MEMICSKLMLIKAGSKIITSDENCDVCEFELLQDLQVHVECADYYKVEKQGILPQPHETKL